MVPKGCKVVPYIVRKTSTGKNLYMLGPSEVTTIIDWYFTETDIEYKTMDFDVIVTLIRLYYTDANMNMYGFQVQSKYIYDI
jgi:hypothetical protein